MIKETFRTRFGLIVALIGMAVGTGNIWRFPRVVAANGGGAFLIPWLLFLFLWSIPLLIIEFSLGKKIRKGVVGVFNQTTRGQLAWLGGFVAICTLAIMCYYSVVTGWCLYYSYKALEGSLFEAEPALLWKNFRSSGVIPLCYHGMIVFLALMVLFQGVRRGIEAISMIMIPALFLILFGLAIYALTLPGRGDALAFLFNADFSRLLEYRVWLEALTQSAWSTGAGWGLALSYACYAKKENHPVLTSFTTAFGNNSISLLAAFVVLVPLFSFFSMPEILRMTDSGNTGLTFVALPGLFQNMQGGRVVGFLFFLALFFAAFTSLIAMFELGVRMFQDFGWSRVFSVFFTGLACLVMGAPSAIDKGFFDNQDWVWGVGLLLSGFFFTLLVRKIGFNQFCEKYFPIQKGVLKFGFKMLVYYFIPLQFIALILWWFFQSVEWDPSRWWSPFSTLSIGTCFFQWGVLLLFLFLTNKYASKWARHS